LADIISLEDLDFRVWKEILKLFREEPTTHIYVVYDLIYSVDRIELYVALNDLKRVVGYVLIWHNPGLTGRKDGVHIWGRDVEKLIKKMKCDKEMIVQVHTPSSLSAVTSALKGLGCDFEIRWHLDMMVTEEKFTPYSVRSVNVVRLSPLNEKHVSLLAKFRARRGDEELPPEALRSLIEYMRYHALIVNDEIASVAGAYIRSNKVWIIGDVYTLPEHRGKGYATAVTSSVTRDAIFSGAVAMLHVEENNLPAVRAYSKLGYTVVARKPWAFVAPR